MMQQEYLFQIANTVISLCVPKKLNINDSYKSFRVKNQRADIVIQFRTWNEKVNYEEGKRIYRGEYDVYEISTGFAIKRFHPDTSEVYFYMPVPEGTQWTAYVKESEWWRFASVSDVFRVISLEKILNRRETMLLHASFIAWQQEGILFSAPSGTGKSTQADLWKKFENAEIINGDRAALSKEQGRWKAHGLPLAGSSAIFRNETYPVRAIVVLRQGKENKLEKIKPVEAFRWIYSEMTVQYWDEEFQRSLLELLREMVLQIPVYWLECLPDQSAVEILKKELEVHNS